MIGCDIIDLRKFSSMIHKEGERFLCRVFTTAELQDRRLERLAGMVAAKEAIMKTGLIKIGSWLDVEIYFCETGQPKARFADENIKCDISISHDGNYAVAIAWKQ